MEKIPYSKRENRSSSPERERMIAREASSFPIKPSHQTESGGFPDQDLNAGNLVFDEENSMILLSEFKDKKTAEAFYKKFNSDLSPLKNFSSLNFSNFIISKDNFQIFYQAKMVESYTEFFYKNYQVTP
jgi:hypothetical protein